MNIKNVIVALIIVALSLYFFPYSIMVLCIILLSYLFSIYEKNKAIHEDLRKIKRHLGLLSEEELEQVEIDEELEYHKALENNPEDIDELNREIEEELEGIRENTEDTDQNKL